MSINLNPTGIYPDYKYTADASSGLSGEGVFIPLTSIPGLSATEASHVADGDYRKLIYGLVSQAESEVNALDDKPAKFSASKSGLTFVDEDTARRNFSFTFNFAVENLDIEPED